MMPKTGSDGAGPPTINLAALLRAQFFGHRQQHRMDEFLGRLDFVRRAKIEAPLRVGVFTLDAGAEVELAPMTKST